MTPTVPPPTAPEVRQKNWFERAWFSGRERFDVVWLALVIGVVTLVFGIPMVVVGIARHQGWFHATLLKPVPDYRILENVRNGIAQAPILDATHHPIDDRLYLSTKGGKIHYYNLSTGLWKTEQPFVPGEFEKPDVVGLRGGSGRDPESSVPLVPLQERPVWGLTAGGGLIMRQNDKWHPLVTDTSWTGPDGKPVAQTEVKSAAVSSDKRWVALVTSGKGLGLYDSPRHRWLKLDGAWQAKLPALQIDHVAFARGGFWIGTAQGLAFIRPGDSPAIVLANEFSGEILSIAVTEKDSVVVLQRNQTTGALRLGELDAPEAKPRLLMDESALFPDANLQAWHHADFAEGKLWLAGKAGVHSYDPVLRRQTQHGKASITCVLSEGSGEFVVGFEGGVGRVRAGSFRTWKIEQEKIIAVQAAAATSGPKTWLALAASGRLFSWNEASDVVTSVFEAQSSQQNLADFSAAMDLGADKVLLLGADGALLHDLQQRSYQDIVPLPPQSGLARLTQGLLTSFTTDHFLYCFRQDGRQATLTVWPLAEARQGNFVPLSPGMYPVGEARAVRPWGLGAAALSVDGTLLTLQEGAPGSGITATKVFGPNPQMAGVKLRDVQTIPTGLVVAADNLVGFYSAESRSWKAVVSMPDGEVAEGIQQWKDHYLLRTASERLFETNAQGSAVAAALNPTPWQLNDATLSSALLDGSKLYLAGPGRVEQYDLALRSVTSSWTLASKDKPPRFLGVAPTGLITLAGDGVYSGSSPIEENLGRVVSASLDGTTLLTVRERNGRRFLRSYDLQKRVVRETYFLNPTAGDGAQEVLDAVLFDEQRIAVSTDRGFRFYDLTARSWIQTQPALLRRGGRIFHVGAYLVLVEGERDSYRLTFVDDARWAWPSPHGDDPAQHGAVRSRLARSYSVDPASQSVVMLTGEGEVVRWQKGTEISLLPAPTQGPAAAWRRTFLREMGPATRLFCTTERELWSYDFARREWQNIPLAAPAANPPWRELNLEPDGNNERITACDSQGRWYVGLFPRSGGEARLDEVWRPADTTFAADPNRLITVSQATGGNPWQFVLDDKIRRYDPEKRKWLDDVIFPGGAGASALYGKVLGRHLALAADGTRGWVATTESDDPLTFLHATLNPNATTFLDDSGALWRLDRNHIVMRSSVINQKYGDYIALTEAPLALAPSDVLSVRRSDDVILWSINRGIVVWDDRRHTLSPSSPGLQALGRIDEAFVANGNLWLRGPGGLLPFAASDPSRMPLKDPQEIRVDESGRVWAQVNRTWQTWNGGRFQPVALPLGGRVFVLEQGTATVIDGAGIPRRWDESTAMTSTRPLPAEWVGTSVIAVAPADDGGWWVRRGNEWGHLRQVSKWGEVAPAPWDVPVKPLGPWSETIHEPLRIRYRGGAALGMVRRYEIVERFSATGDAGSLPSVLVQRGIVRRQPSPDILPSVRSRFARLVDGSTAYDPVLRVDVEPNGRLVAVRPSGPQYLADKGAPIVRGKLDAVPALDAGWLKWDAAQRLFQVQGVRQVTRLAPAEAVRSGAFFFEPVDAVLSKTSRTIQWSNTYGFWTNDVSTLGLSRAGITFDPQKNLPPIRTAAHGRFLAVDRDFSLGASWEARPPARYSAQYGPLTLTEERFGGVVTTLAVAGTTMEARRGSEFVWDAGRLHVAFGNDGVWLQTTGGLVSVDQWGRWERLPADKGRLYGERSGTTWFDSSGRWFLRNGGQWQALPRDPTADRELVRAGPWRWQTRNHKVEVSLDGAPFGFALVADRNGVGFTADKIVGAAAIDGRRWVASEAFLEVIPPGAALPGLTAPRQAKPAVGDFETWRDSAGATTLFLRPKGNVLHWDAASQRFLAATDPRRQWDFAATDRLRFRFNAGRFIQELRADVPNGGSNWIPFNFERGRFPFDCVTGLWANEQHLYLATRAGLLVQGPNSFSLLPGAVQGWWQPNGLVLQGATRVGRPAGQDRMVVNFRQGALESLDGQKFGVTAPHAGSWSRIQTDTWRWQVGSSGQAELSYRNATGTWVPMPAPCDNTGRFPHDQLIDIAWSNPNCGYLWANGWVSVAPTVDTTVGANWHHFDLSAARFRRLFTIPNDVPWTGGRILRAGLYALTQADQVWRFENSAWMQINDPTRTADLKSFMAAPPLLQRNRLRLVKDKASGSALHLEHRNLADEWKPLNWSPAPAGRFAIDAWEHLAPTPDGVWAATAQGFVLFEADSTGKLRINPDRVVINSDLAAERAVVRDLIPENGRWLARINQDSSRLWVGSLTPQKDRGTFSKYAGTDTFADRLLVSAVTNGFWEWRLAGRRNNDPGHLEGRLRGEPIRYESGRFGFDALTAVVAAEGEQLEIMTAGEGWYRSPRLTFAVSDQKRPAVTGPLKPSIARDLFLSVEGEKTFLGVGDESRKFWSVRGNRVDAVDQRLEFFGFDDFWRYESMGSQLMVVPRRDETVVGGAAERKLEEGRFSDDRIKGFPLRTTAGWWVPTEAGVLEWLVPGTVKRIHAPSFVGLAKGDVPRALFLGAGDKPLYVANDGLHFLDARRDLASLPQFTFAPGTEIFSVEAGPTDTLRWRWRVGENIGWSLAALSHPPWRSESGLPLRLDRLPIYESRRGSSRPLPSNVWLDFATPVIASVWETGHDTPTFDFSIPNTFHLLNVISAGDYVLLIGKSEIYELEAEAIARRF